MRFKLKPGMLVKNRKHGALCIVLYVGDDGLQYKTQMYVLQSDLLIDLAWQKTFWVNSLLADEQYEVVYENPSR